MKTLSVMIAASSVASLNETGARLVVWKSVGNSDHATKPLVWRIYPGVAPQMNVSYSGTISAYTSVADDIQPGHVIAPGATSAIKTGQSYVISANSGGAGHVEIGGEKDAVSFQNATGTGYNCGLMQDSSSPYCVVPIFGGGEQQSLFPLDKILVAFATGGIEEGMYLTRVAHAVSSIRIAMPQPFAMASTGLLVDLTSADTRTIGFDRNEGWSWDKGVWATPYPASTELSKILIEDAG